VQARRASAPGLHSSQQPRDDPKHQDLRREPHAPEAAALQENHKGGNDRNHDARPSRHEGQRDRATADGDDARNPPFDGHLVLCTAELSTRRSTP
jgi:hypothetical protein